MWRPASPARRAAYTWSSLSATTSGSKSRARSRPAAARLRRSAGSYASCSSPSASAPTSPAGCRSAVCRSVAISDAPPPAAAATGTPAAIASSITCPKGSGTTDACTKMSRRSSSAPTSERKPRNSTRSAIPSRSASPWSSVSYGSSPNRGAPTMAARTGPSGKARANASRKTFWPFQDASRPIMPTRSTCSRAGPEGAAGRDSGTTTAPPLGGRGTVARVASEFATRAVGSTRTPAA